MDTLSLPVWGQWSILGLSLGINVFIFINYVLGRIPTQSVVDQANKTTEQALQMADKWQRAWEVAEQRGDKNAETLEQVLQATNKIVTTGETTLRILEARPPVMHTPGEDVDE